MSISSPETAWISPDRAARHSLGCGTYLLRIQVPSTRISYSLGMPEVFSAYQLYINGDPALSIGNPDPDHYRDATGSRLVSFFPDENGMITILIAVNNQSYFYSGMTFPPAFGTPQALNYTVESGWGCGSVRFSHFRLPFSSAGTSGFGHATKILPFWHCSVC